MIHETRSDIPLTRSQIAQCQTLLNQFPLLLTIMNALYQKGATLYLVGGTVRDIVMNIPTSDIDIEVHALSLKTLEDTIKQYTPVKQVGSSFGVVRAAHLPIDWSIPRKDSAGRKPAVELIPHLSIKEALRRRDLTINAMGINLKDFTLHDPFRGMQDIERKVLRTPDPLLFPQDPLRLYRVMQFMGRFNFTPSPELNSLCKELDVTTLARERIQQECSKLLLKSQQPSLGFRWLAQLERLSELIPPLGATQGVPQNPVWHPEGDVFEHTMQVIDAAAQATYPTEQFRTIIIYASLCHDLGKVHVTRLQEGIWRSKGHEAAGIEPAKTVLSYTTATRKIEQAVLSLVRCHMLPSQFVAQKASAAAYKRLAHKIAPYATLRMLAAVAYADKRGRNADRHSPFIARIPDLETFIAQATKYGVIDYAEPPLLTGNDLMDLVPPGAELGEALAHAYELQITEQITDKEALKNKVRAFI